MDRFAISAEQTLPELLSCLCRKPKRRSHSLLDRLLSGSYPRFWEMIRDSSGPGVQYLVYLIACNICIRIIKYRRNYHSEHFESGNGILQSLLYEVLPGLPRRTARTYCNIMYLCCNIGVWYIPYCTSFSLHCQSPKKRVAGKKEESSDWGEWESAKSRVTLTRQKACDK